MIGHRIQTTSPSSPSLVLPGVMIALITTGNCLDCGTSRLSCLSTWSHISISPFNFASYSSTFVPAISFGGRFRMRVGIEYYGWSTRGPSTSGNSSSSVVASNTSVCHSWYLCDPPDTYPCDRVIISAGIHCPNGVPCWMITSWFSQIGQAKVSQPSRSSRSHVYPARVTFYPPFRLQWPRPTLTSTALPTGIARYFSSVSIRQ